MDFKKIYKKYNEIFTFKGRWSRKLYLNAFIIYVLFLILNYFILTSNYSFLALPGMILDDPVLYGLYQFAFFVLFSIYLFIWVTVTIYFICKSIQRLHDFNFPWIWMTLRLVWLFVLSVPILLVVMVIFELMLLLKKGTIGLNKYG